MIRIEETSDLATCHALRHQVFVQEQGISLADEIDGRDDEALHFLAVLDGIPVGTARMLVQGSKGKIGRVCVLPQARGRGLGAALIEAACVKAQAMGLTIAKLGAQTHALGFYEGLGFTAFGPVYDDAGIPHRDMERPLG